MTEQASVDAAEKVTIDGWFDAVKAAIPQAGGRPILFMHPNKYVYLLSYYENTQGAGRTVRLPDVPAGTEVVIDRLLPEDVFEVRGATTVRILVSSQSITTHGS
jgi:hypothetical protein